jgi:hypothetical protein
MIGLSALLFVGAFVFLHTSERADGVCMRERFVWADGVSLWPPGTRCTFGEPARTDVLVNPWLAVVLLAIIAGCVVVVPERVSRG